MPNDAMALVRRNLASFGIGRLRENFPAAQGEFSGVFGWFTVFCQPTAPMVADPSALLNQKPAHF